MLSCMPGVELGVNVRILGAGLFTSPPQPTPWPCPSDTPWPQLSRSPAPLIHCHTPHAISGSITPPSVRNHERECELMRALRISSAQRVPPTRNSFLPERTSQESNKECHFPEVQRAGGARSVRFVRHDARRLPIWKDGRHEWNQGTLGVRASHPRRTVFPFLVIFCAF